MRARPSFGWRIPQSIRMTVDLPEPFGPRKIKNRTFADGKGRMIHRREMAEAFG